MAVKKASTRDEVMRQITAEFPKLWTNASEAFNGVYGGIWTTAEEGEVFNYWNCAQKCDPRMEKLLDRNGWFYEFHDAGTVMLWVGS